MLETLARYLPFAIPTPHFMAFAPLDVWARMLLAPPAWVPPRYWLRLALGLFTSAIGTAVTLPERLVLAPVLWVLGRRAGHTLEHGPGVVVVLGYARSGTTHLQNLLCCDPASYYPRWFQVLAPQGFALSWAFLRFFLVPFLSNSRPQDDMAFGPEWPAEDEFAVNNWSCASTLPGTLVLPSRHGFYHRFHALEGLSPREMGRWRRVMWAFCWKLARHAGPGKRLLLKSPSHTARVPALAELFGDRVRFIHISRWPEAVVRSNVTMHTRFAGYRLQNGLSADEIERRIVEEYEATERKYLRDAAALPPGRVSLVRFEDMHADPVGELKRVYAELGLTWTGEFEARLVRYLYSVRDYKPATPATKTGALPAGPSARLAPLAAVFGHDRPPKAVGKLTNEQSNKATNEDRSEAARQRDGETGEETAKQQSSKAANEEGMAGIPLRARMLAVSTAAVCAVVWVGVAYLVGNRLDWLAWPTGVAIGAAAIKASRAGTARLGVLSAALTLLVMIVISWPATFLSEYYPRPVRNWEWGRDVWTSTRVGFLSEANLFWLLMGMVSAYRFASRKHVHPPGRV